MYGGKPTLLYASPFPPQRSGISDYSIILIKSLKLYFKVTLLIDDYMMDDEENYSDFDIMRYDSAQDYSQFDYKLYNFGNNPFGHIYIYDCFLRFPGYVIMHDYILYYLTVQYYEQRGILYSKVYEMAGGEGIALLKDVVKQGDEDNVEFLEQKHLAPLLPLNKEVLDAAEGIIIHSDYTRSQILNTHKEQRVLRINMVDMNEREAHAAKRDSSFAARVLGITDEEFIIGAFGNVASTKLNHLLCEAVRLYNAGHIQPIHYVMAGEGSYCDGYLGKYIHRTGYLNDDDYTSLLKRCNLVSNLRYPSMGETSISLIHAMGLDKPCLVTDNAWFSELPDDAVVKFRPGVNPREISAYLEWVVNGEGKGAMETLAKQAGRLVRREFSSASAASSISDFLLACR